jgi:hypothetical protein
MVYTSRLYSEPPSHRPPMLPIPVVVSVQDKRLCSNSLIQFGKR